jgi:hypothetical protein
VVWPVTATLGAVLSRLRQRTRCAWTISVPVPPNSTTEVSSSVPVSVLLAPPQPARMSVATACETSNVDCFSVKCMDLTFLG